MLTHSSGLPRESVNPYWNGPYFPFPTDKELTDGLEKQNTLYPSSTYLQNSNLVMALLGKVIEEVSGEKYNAYIEKNILEPLGMTDTKTYLPEKLHGSVLAQGYSAFNREGERAKMPHYVTMEKMEKHSLLKGTKAIKLYGSYNTGIT